MKTKCQFQPYVKYESTVSRWGLSVCMAVLVGLSPLVPQDAKAQGCFPGVGANIGVATPSAPGGLGSGGVEVQIGVESFLVAHLNDTITILGLSVASTGCGV